MFSRLIFWPWFTGLIFLAAGLCSIWRELRAAPGMGKVTALGPVLVAASLAAFGAEHLVGARFIMRIVPPWIPGRLFWAYFVGLALLATAVSFVMKRYVLQSTTLLGVMFFLFVLVIHIPNVTAHPADRFAWAVALRDLAFGGGAWAFAGSQLSPNQPRRERAWLITVGRFCLAVPLLFFAIETFLHPRFAPGVPLEKVTPAWIPFAVVWGLLTGAVLLVAGVALFINRKAQLAAQAGLLLLLLSLFFYLPILFRATEPSAMNEAINYVADTLLFAGVVLLAARAAYVAPGWTR